MLTNKQLLDKYVRAWDQESTDIEQQLELDRRADEIEKEILTRMEMADRPKTKLVIEEADRLLDEYDNVDHLYCVVHGKSTHVMDCKECVSKLKARLALREKNPKMFISEFGIRTPPKPKPTVEEERADKYYEGWARGDMEPPKTDQDKETPDTYRDIGLRIDRYGSVVFKPQLVGKKLEPMKAVVDNQILTAGFDWGESEEFVKSVESSLSEQGVDVVNPTGEPGGESFDEAWKRLAKKGKCDSTGGAEYERVSSKWSSRPQSLTSAEFIILECSNVPDPSPLQPLKDLYSGPIPTRDIDNSVFKEAQKTSESIEQKIWQKQAAGRGSRLEIGIPQGAGKSMIDFAGATQQGESLKQKLKEEFTKLQNQVGSIRADEIKAQFAGYGFHLNAEQWLELATCPLPDGIDKVLELWHSWDRKTKGTCPTTCLHVAVQNAATTPPWERTEEQKAFLKPSGPDKPYTRKDVFSKGFFKFLGTDEQWAKIIKFVEDNPDTYQGRPVKQ